MEEVIATSAAANSDNAHSAGRLFPASIEDCTYTSCYCEENVWKLCEHVKLKDPAELNRCYVVFISNKKRQVPLWHQRASKRPDRLVIWDYHVVLIYLHQDLGFLVYDLDTELDFPCPFKSYFAQTIGEEKTLKPEFRRYFRVIRGEEYLREFASDRSHMTKEDGGWMSPPPPYPCIQTPTCQNNIQDFISMETTVGFGTVVSAKALWDMFSGVLKPP
ncbi:hypothetical protein BaRGS_00002754 [Batillaria attramentaria]|uniref:Protein N-terminal glutamine amidohydrolase n=1 Tax=Batillaria attramentaria TaxID=370345 RepID=A0ABD0M341_9CAEN